MNSHDQEPVIDAHLKAALRHAPDAGAMPPEALSQQILRQAREAVVSEAPAVAAAHAEPIHQSASPAWLKGLRAFWDALGHGPMVGATASLMVATVLGVMWWDQSPEEALPPPTRPTTVQTAPEPVAPMPAPLPVPVPAALPPTAKAPESPLVRTLPKATIPERDQPAVPRSRTPPAAAHRRESLGASPAASSDVTARQMPEAHQAQAEAQASPEAPERVLLKRKNLGAPSAVAAAPVEASVPVPAARLPMAGARTQSLPTDSLPAAAPAPMGPTPSQATASDRPSPASARPAYRSTFDASQAMRTLARQLSQVPSTWMWQQGPQDPQVVAPSVAAFMGRVQAATDGKWSRTDSASEGPALADWRLRGPEPHGFSLKAGQLRWTRPEGAQWVADVDAAEVEAWVRELAAMR